MNLLNLPWLEIAIALTLVGFPGVSRVRNPERTYRFSMAFIGAAFACTVLAWLAFYVGVPGEEIARYSIQPALFGRQIFAPRRAQRPRRAGRRPPPPLRSALHFPESHAPVLVLLVHGRRNSPPHDL